MAEQGDRWSFPCAQTRTEWMDLEEALGPPQFDARRGLFLFAAEDGLFELRAPEIFPRPNPLEDGRAWLERCAKEPLPGTDLVLLFQAGAAAIGVFEEGEPIRHKVLKRYVVRGKGRAQPTHLKTKGKSRYGSRLRLQNAALLLEEVYERIALFSAEHGPFDTRFKSVPIRLWADLCAQDPQETTLNPSEFRRIPIHVHPPDFAELKRVYRFLMRGHVRKLPAASP